MLQSSFRQWSHKFLGKLKTSQLSPIIISNLLVSSVFLWIITIRTLEFFARGETLKWVSLFPPTEPRRKQKHLISTYCHPTYKFILPKYYLKPFTADLKTAGRKTRFLPHSSPFSLFKYSDKQFSSELNHPVTGFSSYAFASCCRLSVHTSSVLSCPWGLCVWWRISMLLLNNTFFLKVSKSFWTEGEVSNASLNKWAITLCKTKLQGWPEIKFVFHLHSCIVSFTGSCKYLPEKLVNYKITPQLTLSVFRSRLPIWRLLS